jgi:hypothetical protein
VKRALKIAGAFVAFVCIFVGALLVYEEGVREAGDLALALIGAVVCAAGATYFWAIHAP